MSVCGVYIVRGLGGEVSKSPEISLSLKLEIPKPQHAKHPRTNQKKRGLGIKRIMQKRDNGQSQPMAR